MKKYLLLLTLLILLSSFTFGVTQADVIDSWECEGDFTSATGGFTLVPVNGATADSTAIFKLGTSSCNLTSADNTYVQTNFTAYTSAHAIEMWVYIDGFSAGAYATYFSTNASNLGGGGEDYSVIGNNIPAQNYREAFELGSAQGVNLDVFQHLVFTDDGTNFRFYLNNTLIATNSNRPVAGENVIFGQWATDLARGLDGYIDSTKIFNINLSTADVNQLFNNGTGVTFAGLAPVGVLLNQSLETALQFLQIGSVAISGGGFTDILSGSFNISVNQTKNYFAAVIPISAVSGAGSVGTCRLLVNGSDFNSTFSRTMVTGEPGNMYITTENITLDTGTFLTQLQCERTSGGGTYTVQSATIDGHLLINENNQSLNSLFIPINVSIQPAVFLKMIQEDINFTTSNLTADGVKNSTILLDWNAQYTFDVVGVINSFLFFNLSNVATNCSQYPRNNGVGIFGSIGGDCVKFDAGFDNTYVISGNAIGNGSIIANIHVKEFITNVGEVASLSLNGTIVNGTDFTNSGSVIINSSANAVFDIFAKAGVPHTSSSGTAFSSFFLQLDGGTVNSSVVFNTVDLADNGISVVSFLFEDLTPGSFNISLQGFCDNMSCEITGGELTAYIANPITELIESFNVTATNIYNGSTINVFNVTTSNGLVFSTTSGLVTVDSNFVVDNLTIRSQNFFSTTIIKSTIP